LQQITRMEESYEKVDFDSVGTDDRP
jgi:hypothetical protein